MTQGGLRDECAPPKREGSLLCRAVKLHVLPSRLLALLLALCPAVAACSRGDAVGSASAATSSVSATVPAQAAPSASVAVVQHGKLAYTHA